MFSWLKQKLMTAQIYPYTAENVCDLLEIEMAQLQFFTEELGMKPHHDKASGRSLYSLTQLETLRHRIKKDNPESDAPPEKQAPPKTPKPASRRASTSSDESKPSNGKPQPVLEVEQTKPITAEEPAPLPVLAEAPSLPPVAPNGHTAEKTALKSSRQTQPATPTLSRSELSAIVDNVSNAKELILRDLSQLLDDKLAGLDDVVVELIRSKTQIDSLKDELKQLEARQTDLQQELSRFKPTAFGFYRKER